MKSRNQITQRSQTAKITDIQEYSRTNKITGWWGLIINPTKVVRKFLTVCIHILATGSTNPTKSK